MYDIYNLYNIRDPPTGALITALNSVLRQLGQSYVIIDGIDECPIEANERFNVMSLLGVLWEWGLPNLNVLVTSRWETDISRIVVPLLTHPPPIEICAEQIEGDIRLFLKKQLKVLDTQIPDLGDIKDMIETTLLERANGSYVTAYFSLPLHADLAGLDSNGFRLC
jgi:hypothetical protein